MITTNTELAGHICNYPPYGDVLVLHREYAGVSHYATLLTLNHSDAALKGQVVFSKQFEDLTYKRVANTNDFGADRFKFDNPQQPVLKRAIERFKIGDHVNCRIQRYLSNDVVLGQITEMTEDYYLVIKTEAQTNFQCHHFNVHLTSEYKVEPPSEITIGSVHHWQGKTGIVVSTTRSHFMVQEINSNQKWQFSI